MNEDEEAAAIESLRAMNYKDITRKPNIFTFENNLYTVKPIPLYADHLTSNNINVKYGAWGYTKESI